MAHKARIPQKLEPWIEARKRHGLSHAQVGMARELGMNPKKLGRLRDNRQEPWKLPLPQYIETLYEKRFGRMAPEHVRSIEEVAQDQRRKKEERRRRKAERKGGGEAGGSTTTP
jgi:hypothetical protein